MKYEIKECKICKESIKNLSKKYGGSGIYYSEVIKKHIELDHNISFNEYMKEYYNLDQPICLCGICNKLVTLCIKGSEIYYPKYECGRYPNTMKWANEAKINRLGKNNPMFGKKSWNKNLTKDNNEILKNISDKHKGKKVSIETKKKQSESAKKRKIHGHSGKKHSDETKRRLKESTANLHKRGVFKFTKTKPHIEMISILKDLKINFKEEYVISYWSFDIYLTDYKVLIEVDGDYWHSNPKFYPNGPKTKVQKINFARDISKNNFCKKNNLKLYRFWEYDIINNKEKIKCSLQKLLKLKK